ncbi:MAG TPA: hypothetical protein VF273_02535 [Pelobium sp.]
MLIQNHYNDSEKVRLLSLLTALQKIRKDMGAYIEHYYHNEDTIIIKLTNGIVKINEAFLERYPNSNVALADKELNKLAEAFVNALA